VTRGEQLAIECHAEAEYPREACGGIVVKGEDRRFLPWHNVHESPSHEFMVSARDLSRLAGLQRNGWLLKVIYHSHIDTGDHFSYKDRDLALSNGKPYYPDVTHVVVSVRKGQVASISSYRWDESQRDFVKGVFAE
jgi:proteasome lid subunit RPN8/RPN11